ncbi:MAG: arylsulfatase [Verrucomicrobiales bacterium]
MIRIKSLAFVTTVLATVLAAVSLGVGAEAKPNIVFIMADDLGYGELGSFGQEKIQTPELDRMAQEGMKLTSFYAGSTVCAPSRSVLMTGQHTGRTWVRGNAGAADRGPQTLRPEDVTVAEKLKEAGYATALTGKWGLGELDSVGHPNRQGFDYFYGYLNQRHAHNYYPTFLVRNDEVVPLKNVVSSEWEAKRVASGAPDDGAGWAHPEGRIEYSHDLIADEALTWLDETAGEDAPFFLYLALTIPHANNEGGRGTGDGQEVPDHGIYADKDEAEGWSDPNKGQAAMITRMDRDVGRLLEKLREKGVAENTLVIFTSDNGHHKEGGNDPEFFDANGPLKGMKRDLTEGGIRVPTIAWWPGEIEPGSESDHPAYLGDFMATACDLAGIETPENTQSISFLPTLRGQPESQKEHDYLYWEFYERGSKQAVRFGDWKAIRQPIFTGQTALYDLSEDLGEENDVSGDHPDIVAKAAAYMEEAHKPNPNWKPRGKK